MPTGRCIHVGLCQNRCNPQVLIDDVGSGNQLLQHDCVHDQCSVLFSKFALIEKEEERARFLRERINGGW